VCVLEAEDGIRDWSVTGVQTCALPIYSPSTWPSPQLTRATYSGSPAGDSSARPASVKVATSWLPTVTNPVFGSNAMVAPELGLRSEERRVGKESRCGGWAEQ